MKTKHRCMLPAMLLKYSCFRYFACRFLCRAFSLKLGNQEIKETDTEHLKLAVFHAHHDNPVVGQEVSKICVCVFSLLSRQKEGTLLQHLCNDKNWYKDIAPLPGTDCWRGASSRTVVWGKPVPICFIRWGRAGVFVNRVFWYNPLCRLFFQ
jgi:hypothetical protein